MTMLFCSQSLLGEFNKEQEAFIKEKQGKVSDAAVPPWVGCPNEESLKEEFLTLSTVSALMFIHRFYLKTAALFITHQATLPLLKTAYFACFYSIMTMLCMPPHQVKLTTLLALPPSASSYAHNMACNACLRIELNSQHCLQCLSLYQVTLTILLAVHASASS